MPTTNQIPVASLYEIRSLKTFRGREGFGFNAKMYRGTRQVALVIDHGDGGCMRYEWITQDDNKAFQEYVAALPPEAIPADAEDWEKSLYPNGFRAVDADTFVGNLVDQYTLQKALKTKVVFTTSQRKGKLETLETSHKGEPEKVRADILKQFPDAKFLGDVEKVPDQSTDGTPAKPRLSHGKPS